jgi:AIR synthase related protein, N-terminal domain
VRVEHGDDGAVVQVGPSLAVVVTADFFTPVVDDAYTFGRIAAANALSDIYAMGGEPLVGLNLLGWPREKLPADLAAEVLRGGLDVGRAAHCHVAGGHSIDDPEPKYGMAVTGTADPARLLRIDAGHPGSDAGRLPARREPAEPRLGAPAGHAAEPVSQDRPPLLPRRRGRSCQDGLAPSGLHGLAEAPQARVASQRHLRRPLWGPAEVLQGRTDNSDEGP